MKIVRAFKTAWFWILQIEVERKTTSIWLQNKHRIASSNSIHGSTTTFNEKLTSVKTIRNRVNLKQASTKTINSICPKHPRPHLINRQFIQAVRCNRRLRRWRSAYIRNLLVKAYRAIQHPKENPRFLNVQKQLLTNRDQHRIQRNPSQTHWYQERQPSVQIPAILAEQKEKQIPKPRFPVSWLLSKQIRRWAANTRVKKHGQRLTIWATDNHAE